MGPVMTTSMNKEVALLENDEMQDVDGDNDW